MKNIENAARPKSAISILPPRPFRPSGKVVQMAFRPLTREGKSCIPTLNQTLADSRIPRISYLMNWSVRLRPLDCRDRRWDIFRLFVALGSPRRATGRREDEDEDQLEHERPVG